MDLQELQSKYPKYGLIFPTLWLSVRRLRILCLEISEVKNDVVRPTKKGVSSKYIFCMAICAICCIVFELETLFMPGLGTSDIKLFAFMFLIVSVFIGIYLPIQYKFGYEKTKFAFGMIIMASPFILPLFMRAGSLNLNFLSIFSPYLVYGGIVLIGFAILAISASLSIKIYDKADLA